MVTVAAGIANMIKKEQWDLSWWFGAAFIGDRDLRVHLDGPSAGLVAATG